MHVHAKNQVLISNSSTVIMVTDRLTHTHTCVRTLPRHEFLFHQKILKSNHKVWSVWNYLSNEPKYEHISTEVKIHVFAPTSLQQKNAKISVSPKRNHVFFFFSCESTHWIEPVVQISALYQFFPIPPLWAFLYRLDYYIIKGIENSWRIRTEGKSIPTLDLNPQRKW